MHPPTVVFLHAELRSFSEATERLPRAYYLINQYQETIRLRTISAAVFLPVAVTAFLLQYTPLCVTVLLSAFVTVVFRPVLYGGYTFLYPKVTQQVVHLRSGGIEGLTVHGSRTCNFACACVGLGFNGVRCWLSTNVISSLRKLPMQRVRTPRRTPLAFFLTKCFSIWLCVPAENKCATIQVRLFI